MAIPALTTMAVGAFIRDPGFINRKFQEFTSGEGSHSFSQGIERPGDQMLFKERIRKDWKMGYAEHTFKFNGESGYKVTAIYAIDHWTDDTGGNAVITKGGIGCSTVEVKVTSRFNRGFDFSVTVFGRA